MNEDYTKKEFYEKYELIKIGLTTGISPETGNCSLILGGQPGAGKSTFYSTYSNTNYIVIDTDSFRRFHPNIEQINRLDAENYAERTQDFANKITNKLIDELSKNNYNLIIEGTLRTVEVPYNTCIKLKKQGHTVNLIIVACDAITAWKNTIGRAEAMLKMKQKPRLIPFDKYDFTIHHISENLRKLRESNIFDKIDVIDRNGKSLLLDHLKPEEVLSNVLDLEKWDRQKRIYEKEFLEVKLQILTKEIEDHKKNEKY